MAVAGGLLLWVDAVTNHLLTLAVVQPIFHQKQQDHE
jgi:hypothetical protein